MDRIRVAGALLVAAALAGYVVGVLDPYPWRSASLVGVMVGVTLLAFGEYR